MDKKVIQKEFFTVEDFHDYTGIPVRTIREIAGKHLIDFYRPVPGQATRMYFKRGDIDTYMASSRVPKTNNNNNTLKQTDK